MCPPHDTAIRNLQFATFCELHWSRVEWAPALAAELTMSRVWVGVVWVPEPSVYFMASRAISDGGRAVLTHGGLP